MSLTISLILTPFGIVAVCFTVFITAVLFCSYMNYRRAINDIDGLIDIELARCRQRNAMND